MKNYTVRLPEKLIEEMRRHRDVNWSEVIRRSIEDYLKKLRELERSEPAEKLLKRLMEAGVDPKDLEPFDYETEVKMYREVVKREWSRQNYMTRV